MGFIKFITQQYVNWYVLKKCHPTIGILIYCGCMMLQGGAPPVMLELVYSPINYRYIYHKS